MSVSYASLSSHSKDFRRLLQMELIKRCERNPRYSLRSFAQSLHIHPSSLSQILRGKRTLSPKVLRKLALSLGLGPKEIDTFALIQKPEKLKQELKQKNLKELSSDLFAVMSDWYHDAILELTRLPHFKPESRWIARVLGITASEVNVAVERLLSLEFLEIDSSGKWINHLGDNTTIVQTDLTTAALRKLQKQILELSIKALDEVEKPRRDHTSSMMSVDPKDMEVIKGKIKNFRRDLLSFAERRKTKPENIYQLAISFFPLTRGTRSTL